jgi:RimJ/RimL family protein N-acetyltransferase
VVTGVVVETERLRLREWKPADIDGFAVLARDPRVTRYINGGRAATDEQIGSFLERQIITAARAGWCRWALELREPAGGEPRGVVGFAGPGCTFAPDIEFGWWLHPDLWGRGLATEAAQAGVRHCFAVIGFPRLISMVHPENAASLAVARKVGFEVEGLVEHSGITLVRHVLDNPLGDLPRNPRYRHDCENLPHGSSLGTAHPKDRDG